MRLQLERTFGAYRHTWAIELAIFYFMSTDFVSSFILLSFLSPFFILPPFFFCSLASPFLHFSLLFFPYYHVGCLGKRHWPQFNSFRSNLQIGNQNICYLIFISFTNKYCAVGKSVLSPGQFLPKKKNSAKY